MFLSSSFPLHTLSHTKFPGESFCYPLTAQSRRSQSYHSHFRWPKIQNQSLQTKPGNLIKKKKKSLMCSLSFCLSILMNSALQGMKTIYKEPWIFLHRRQSVHSLIIHHENKNSFNHFKHCLLVWLKCLLALHLPLPLLKDCVRSLTGATRGAGRPIVQQG